MDFKIDFLENGSKINESPTDLRQLPIPEDLHSWITPHVSKQGLKVIQTSALSFI